MSSIPMRWRDWFNTARLCYELRELRQGWAQYERIHDALLGRYETKIAALESENARLKEALRECVHQIQCVRDYYPIHPIDDPKLVYTLRQAAEALGD